MKHINDSWQSKLSHLVLALLLFLPFAHQLSAQKIYAVESVPNVQLQDSTRLVTDEAGVLSRAQEAAMNAELLAIRQKHSVEFAVVVLPSIGDEILEDFSLKLARHWGIGRKDANNGLLLLMVIDQRRVRFESGYGLEGDLTDAKLSRIIRQQIIPQFRRGDFAQGLADGVRAVSEILDGTYVAPASKEGSEEGSWLGVLGVYLIIVTLLNLWLLYKLSTIRKERSSISAVGEYELFRQKIKGVLALLFFLFLPGFIFTYFWAKGREAKLKKAAKKCPSCNTMNMSEVEHLADRLALLAEPEKLEEQLKSRTHHIYRCSNCNHSESVTIDNPQSEYKVCPNCSAKTLQYLGKRAVRVDGQRMIQLDWHCLNCGKDYHNRHRDDSDENAALFGAILGSMIGGRTTGGGGFGGGGFGGFGGGGFGGGGASGGW